MLEDGPPLAAQIALFLPCDAAVDGMLEDGRGTPPQWVWFSDRPLISASVPEMSRARHGVHSCWRPPVAACLGADPPRTRLCGSPPP